VRDLPGGVVRGDLGELFALMVTRELLRVDDVGDQEEQRRDHERQRCALAVQPCPRAG
jgi:hypothetical protein